MRWTSTLQLLRIPFSFFLMPVYWFALSQVNHIDKFKAILVFIILHLLLYPASNGYNSYMDRDTGSIGGIKNPQQPTRQLYTASVLLDISAVVGSFLISIYFVLGILAFIAASRAYSYRGIRLKQYPFTGYLTVILFQGGMIFFLVMHGCSSDGTIQVPITGMITASLLIGGFYPLTQVYQHQQDKDDGVITLSYKLGYDGTFIFTAIIYLAAMMMLAIYMGSKQNLQNFYILQLFFIPVLFYFVWWFIKVHKNNREANFKNTMMMNFIASVCTNAAFIFLFLIEKIE